MTAGFDAATMADRVFRDALSGPDGTWDPAPTMPVLEMYPDALSAPMPAPDSGGGPALPAVPVPPPVPPDPSWDSATPSSAGTRSPGPGRRPAQQRSSPARRGSATRPPVTPKQPARVQPALATPRRSTPSSGRSPSSGRRGESARDVFEAFRQQFTGSMEAARQGAENWGAPTPGPARSHREPQAAGAQAQRPSAAPGSATRAQLRRNAASAPGRKSSAASGVWAVLVFIVIAAFATGWGQRIIEAISELFRQ